MRVIPLTSILSHKGRGSPKRDDSLSLEVEKIIKHSPRLGGLSSGLSGEDENARLSHVNGSGFALTLWVVCDNLQQ